MEIECAGPIDLKDAGSKYQLLFECALDLLFFVDIDGNFIDVNLLLLGSMGMLAKSCFR